MLHHYLILQNLQVEGVEEEEVPDTHYLWLHSCQIPYNDYWGQQGVTATNWCRPLAHFRMDSLLHYISRHLSLAIEGIKIHIGMELEKGRENGQNYLSGFIMSSLLYYISRHLSLANEDIKIHMVVALEKSKLNGENCFFISREFI